MLISFLLLLQIVCDLVLRLNEVDLTLSCSHCSDRPYVILFDVLTISVLTFFFRSPYCRPWVILFSAWTMFILPCLILAADSTWFYSMPDNDLTMSDACCFFRKYVILFNAGNVNLTVFCSYFRPYVILFNVSAVLIWPCLVLAASTESMWSRFMPRQC